MFLNHKKRIEREHNKTFKMYGVIPVLTKQEQAEIDSGAKQLPLYTLVSTFAEAVEYSDKHLRLVNDQHFRLWCPLHNFKPDDPKAWARYADTVIDYNDPRNQVTIIDVYYIKKDLATMLRLYSQCAPIGCSFDEEFEVEAFLNRVAPKKKTRSKSKSKKAPLNGDDPEISQKHISDSKTLDK